MNSDDSRESNSCTVRSKYFAAKSAMDDSLSDFQEPKKCSTCPKNTAKTKTNKPRKAPKKIRGQKDIRKALQSKKNDLESYSKDFDKVCKKAGLDVDSEQLQLAIALSKSLQDSVSPSSEPSETTQILNTRERIGKIRTTLQEYGFKVPDIKIAGNTRKPRKPKKSYKLISTSETEKKEVIVNKYSEILLQDITHCRSYYSDVDPSDIPLYYLATHVTYDVLKSVDTFYVNNLIDKTTSTGILLKDWSKIPGRPVSPKLFKPISNMNFSEIECSQDELDIVLSGSLKSCKNVLSNKNKDLCSYRSSKVTVDRQVNYVNIEKKLAVEEDNIIEHDSTIKQGNNSLLTTTAYILTKNIGRSCSPDLFDDDAPSILDSSKNSMVLEINPNIQNTGTKTDLSVMDLTECVQHKTLKFQSCDTPPLHINSDQAKRKSNEFIEITECVQFDYQNKFMVMNKPRLQLTLSQNSNVTKRKTNDFMEITDCVAHLKSVQNNNNIDLTQSHFIEENNIIVEAVLDQNVASCEVGLNPDLSLKQKSSTQDKDLVLMESPENHDNDETKNEIPTTPLKTNSDKSIESLDLTQSSNSSDELPFVSLTAKNNSLDETIIVHYDYADINRKEMNLQKEADAHIDLTQYSGKVDSAGSQYQSFFEEFEHDHSHNTEESKESNRKSNKLSQTNKDLTRSRKSGGSGGHGESSKCYLEDCSILLSGSDNKIRLNTERERTNCNIQEKSLPVEYHCCNIGLRPVRPGNVDLTQISPEDKRESRSKRQSHLKKSDGLNSNTVEHSNSEPSTANTNTQHRRNTINDSFIIEEVPLPVEIYPCNLGFKQAKPGNVDLTQSPNENACTRKPKCRNNKYVSSTEENNSKCSQHKSSVVDCGHRQENLSSTKFRSSDDESPREGTRHPKSSYKQSKANTSISPIKQNEREINDEQADIDLTQGSGSSVELSQANSNNVYKENINVSIEYNEPITSKNSQRCSSLGKKDDVSIDYDDFINTEPNQLSSSRNISSKSISYDKPDENLKKLSRNDSFASSCSQNSEVFEISDKELDYSLHQSKLEIPKGNFAFGGILIMDNLSNLGATKESSDFHKNSASNVSNDVIDVEFDKMPIVKNKQANMCREISPIKHRRITEIATPQRQNSDMFTVVTPKNSEMIIKINNVTPMLDYESMTTSEIHKELDKYGIKPFKRKRAIQLLTHIYNQTHPLIEDFTDELASPPKRHKPNEPEISPRKRISPRKILISPAKNPEFNYGETPSTSKDNAININKGKENSNKGKGKRKCKNSQDNQDCSAIEIVDNNFESTQRSRDINQDFEVSESLFSTEITCKPEDWVFQKKEKAKVHSCRVPLHIAFHNYVMSRRDLREAILCYEPVEIDAIHKDLVGYGHRYDPKDLLKFLDKKCITVKTADNDARNKKRS